MTTFEAIFKKIVSEKAVGGPRLGNVWYSPSWGPPYIGRRNSQSGLGTDLPRVLKAFPQI